VPRHCQNYRLTLNENAFNGRMRVAQAAIPIARNQAAQITGTGPGQLIGLLLAVTDKPRERLPMPWMRNALTALNTVGVHLAYSGGVLNCLFPDPRESRLHPFHVNVTSQPNRPM